MSDSDQRPEIEATEELLADMPLPSDAKTFFLGGLFTLAMLTAVYVARDIVLPMIFAVMLNLLMQPALRALERLRVPKALGSILLILVVLAAIVGIGAAVSGPAEAWIAKLPEGIPRIVERLSFLDAPIKTLRKFLTAANNFGAQGPQPSSPGPLDGGAILSSVFAGTRSFAGGLFTTVMFLYFLLVAGDSFLRRLVEVLPRFASKRQAVDISQQIERDISAYLVTITLMNALVGAATALVMWSTGVGDPILWGTVAFILNYVPILGPAAAFFIFLFAGSLTIAFDLAGPAPGGALCRHPCDRRRDGDADASRQTIHAQSGSRGLLFRVLVLAVGRPRRNSFGADPCDHQNRVRSDSPARGAWPCSLGLKTRARPLIASTAPLRHPKREAPNGPARAATSIRFSS